MSRKFSSLVAHLPNLPQLPQICATFLNLGNYLSGPFTLILAILGWPNFSQIWLPHWGSCWRIQRAFLLSDSGTGELNEAEKWLKYVANEVNEFWADTWWIRNRYTAVDANNFTVFVINFATHKSQFSLRRKIWV